MKTVLLTGGSGALGSSLQKSLAGEKRPIRLIPPSHEEFDVTNFAQTDSFMKKAKVDVILHCAALTDLEMCQKEPKLAFEVNTLGTRNMALLASKYKARLVYISSEAVYSGYRRRRPYTEDDIPSSPLNFYGWTKLMGEWWAREVCLNYAVIRPGWLFGPTPELDKKFVTKIVDLIKAGEQVRAINDIFGSPTYSMDAAEKILEIVENEREGIFHIVNTGSATRYAMAKLITEVFVPSADIEPVGSDCFPSTIRRSRYSVLKSKYSFLRMRDWESALRFYLENFFVNEG